MYDHSDEIVKRIEKRNAAFAQFRETYNRLDEVINALYHPALYTVQEYDELSSEYRALVIKADRLEKYLRDNFPAKNLDSTIESIKLNAF